jgi:glycogen debranching enzyme
VAGASQGPSRGAALLPAPASLAAGLEHFATGFMRVWGRDTFISLRGLLLVTGRFGEARAALLAFASVLRHGLVPNLMDSGRSPRFNCRDATWWWLQALQDYCALAPEGSALLRQRVHRRFPSDDEADYAPSDSADPAVRGCLVYAPRGDRAGGAAPPLSWTLAEAVQDVLQRHARGVRFREWGAGPRIDAHMRDPGFEVAARLDPASGLVFGGNAHNCGTWMDKMGSAPANAGEPATPRDGCAVEIAGLVYSCVRWLGGLAAEARRQAQGGAASGSAAPQPPMSLPSSSGVSPAASAAAAPPEEPPGVRPRSQGLLVVP